MVFSSYIFVLLFLPLSLFLFFGLNKIDFKAANIALLAMSWWFYGYFNISYLFLLVASIIVNYIITVAMDRTFSVIKRKMFFVAGILINVGFILYFKYYDFFAENLNNAFGVDIPVKDILLPLGISFFTFQQISYVVDCYRDDNIHYSFLDYAVYVSFFPQLIAGPIVLHSEMIPQFKDTKNRKWNWDNFSTGLMIFTIGLFKKVMIADLFGKLVDWGFNPANVSAISTVDTWIVMISYTFQIYFDFSGYSDMAIGIGRMFNLIIPQNFDSPYRALSVYDFWKRWHLTLTRFLRTYIYFPLGGNKKSKIRTYLNVMIVYLISGIWHGANWTFILWGVIHGVAIVIYRATQRWYDRIFAGVRWVITFMFVNVMWLLFRSNNIIQWCELVKKLFSFDDCSSSLYIDDMFFKVIREVQNRINMSGGSEGLFAYVIFPIITIIIITVCFFAKNTSERSYRFSVRSMIVTVMILMSCIASFGREMSFLYFNF